MSSWTQLRTVVEDAAAQEAADSFAATVHRFDEAYDALKWLLCRTPEIGISNDEGQHLFIQAGDELALTPIIAAVYTFTADEVIIHGVQTFDAPEEDEAGD
jgi:hypothetical protein